MRHRAALGNFADVLRWRAAEQPDATAFTWLRSGPDHDDIDLSYAELDRRARAVATLLQQEGPAGERALLLFAPGLDFVAALFGCFYAGWIAVPAYPPPLNQRLSRVQALARDAQPRIVLTSTALRMQVQARLGAEPDLEQLRWRSLDDITSMGHASVMPPSRDQQAEHFPSAVQPGDLAVLQYTSGSTAAPRGVLLTHANLLHNTAQIEKRFDIVNTPESRGVIWLPPYHDMGLVGGILEGVFAGFPIDLMAPVVFLQRPRRWLEAITRSRATISGGPNFAYDLCVDRIAPAERAGLDLSSWHVAFNGSEPVRETTLRRFMEAFGPFGFRPTAFYPCYGLAEATLMVTGGCASAEPVVIDGATVGCGQSIDDQQVVIVEPSTRTRSAPGQVGEVWVAGPSVAGGYWHQPVLTREIFQAELSDDATGPGNTRYLRTGDLGFVRDGELCITGRLKSVLIFGGRKIQAEDIEATLAEAQTALRPTGVVALSTDTDGSERLVVVTEVHRKQQSIAELEAVARSIRARVAEAHQLPVWAVVLTRPGGVPRTSSGKVQRAACREAFLQHQLHAVYEWRASAPGVPPIQTGG